MASLRMVGFGFSSSLTFALMRASMTVVLVAVVVMVTHLRNTKKTKKQQNRRKEEEERYPFQYLLYK